MTERRWCAVMILTCVLLSACAHHGALRRTGSGIYHTVGPGETLWRICHTYQVAIDPVVRANRINDPASITTGTRLFIPGVTRRLRVTPQRQPAAPQPRAKSTPPPKPKRVTASATANSGFSWPVAGRIIRTFGVTDGIRHDGITIRANPGDPVLAARSGRVVFADILAGYGNTIIIQHNHDYASVYAHTGDHCVSKGQWVGKGTRIACVAPPAFNATPSVHFQIRRKNLPCDPLPLLPKPR